MLSSRNFLREAAEAMRQNDAAGKPKTDWQIIVEVCRSMRNSCQNNCQILLTGEQKKREEQT